MRWPALRLLIYADARYAGGNKKQNCIPACVQAHVLESAPVHLPEIAKD